MSNDEVPITIHDLRLHALRLTLYVLLLLNLGFEFLSAVGTEKVLFPDDSRFLLSPFLSVQQPGGEGHQYDDHDRVGHIGKQHKQNIESHQQEGRNEDDQKGVVPGQIAVLLKRQNPVGPAIGTARFQSFHFDI